MAAVFAVSVKKFKKGPLYTFFQDTRPNQHSAEQLMEAVGWPDGVGDVVIGEGCRGVYSLWRFLATVQL